VTVAAVIGFDLGGTGARGRLAPLADGSGPAADAVSDTPLRRNSRGIDGAATAATLRGLAAALRARHPAAAVAAVAVGCAGAGIVGADLRAHLPAALRAVTDAGTVLMCSDSVTAFLGALDGRPGVVLAAGTGVVAVGSDLARWWRRVDGWGDLLGDLGGGAWIGRAGLVAALRAQDGRPHGSVGLLDELCRRFGDPASVVAELHSRDERATVLASFAPAVLAAARAGDPAAARIRARACRHLAETIGAAWAGSPPGSPPAVSVTGRLVAELDGGLAAELGYDPAPPVGDGCAGAVRLARAAATGTLPAVLVDRVTVSTRS
jgi:N-acetylglucosamine kinase-like BadF-type ATPase